MYNLRLLRPRSCNSIKAIAALVPHRLLATTHKRHPQLVQLDISSDLPELRQRQTLSIEEWQRLRHQLIDNYKYITAHNVDSTIVGICNSAEQLPLAKSYLEYLRAQQITPNAATLGRLLRTYHAAYQVRALSEAEQQEILELCHTLRSAHETLDANSCEHIIHGLVATAHWQQAMPLLDMMRLTTTPTVTAYSALIVKAFEAAQPALAWQLLEEMLQLRKLPKCEVYRACLQHIASDVSTLSAQLEQLLQFLERHDILISESVAQQLQALSQQQSKHLQVATTQLNRAGKCAVCEQQLQHVAISEAQFEQLRDSFLNKVLIRNDVFQKSTPEEVARFKQFVERTAPYDCVIDGLNVAYSTGAKKSPQQLAQLVANVVRYFKERHKRVLVLGRQHMKHWSKPAMQYIHNNASVFFTSNISHDDPFLLYATLRSGQSTDFFSRDLMRAHAFLLGPALKPIFRRWQQEHQFSLVTQTQTGRIVVKEPIRCRLSAHKSDSSTWHIPCCAAYTPNPPDSFELPEKWLCLRLIANPMQIA